MSLDAWQTRGEGRAAYMEKHDRGAIVQWVIGFSRVAVSTDGGETWAGAGRAAHCLADADRIGFAFVDALRSVRASRATPRGPSATDRLAGHPTALAQIEAAESAVAREARRARAERAPSPARAARGLERKGPGEAVSARGERRSDLHGAEPPADLHRLRDCAEAVDLAWSHIAALSPAVQGEAGNASLFGAAVDLVRGFGLLPDGYALILLEHYNVRAIPPWSARELRRALVAAEATGKLGWFVLYFRALSRRGGGGAGEGPRHG